MVKSLNSFSRTIDTSFRYAKEDLNTLKMKSSFLEEKILELKKIDKNLKTGLTELRQLVLSIKKKEIKPAVKKTVMRELKKQFTDRSVKKAKKKLIELQFYDVKARKRFSSKIYKEVTKNKTLFAVSRSPYGNYECYRIIKKV